MQSKHKKHEESVDFTPAPISDTMETVKQELADIKDLIRKRDDDEG